MPGQEQQDERRVTYFGVTHTRGKKQMFGIRAPDRLKHMYVIGKTGVGKSTMLENMAIQDIQNGEGVIFVDPHGSSAEKLLDFVPHDRIKDVIYFAPFDMENPIAFNIMENVGFDQRHNVVSNLMGVFERLWADAWSARMSYILQNTLLALLEYPDSTLVDVNRMLVNKEFRKAVVEKVTDPIVKSFWVDEFANYGDRYTQEATPAIQNKVGQLVSNPLVRNIIAQPKSSFDLRKIMDEKKILIANLSKGRMGDANSTMIGAVLVIRTYIAAMSRANESAASMKKLPPCYFYVDEFQNVVNRAFTNILSESRKYKLALIIANQYIKQMDQKEDSSVKDAVFGNVGTTVAFKVGPLDAEELEPLFAPTFAVEDMVGLGVGQIYLTLSIDGITSPPFSAETIPPIEAPVPSYREEVVAFSRQAYGKARKEVEEFVNNRTAEFPMLQKQKKDGPRDGGFKASPARSPREVLSSGDRSPRVESRPLPQAHLGAAPRPVVTPPPPIARAEVNAPRPTPPRETSRAEPQERNALRAAIEAARTKNEAAIPQKSPAEVLRAKKGPEPHQNVRQAQASSATPREQKPQNQDKGEARGPAESAARTGEVSPDILARVLNGGD